MKPKLELIVDVNADIQNAKSFVNYGEFVDCFLPPDLQYIIREKLSNEERDKILTEYTKHIYETDREGIERGVEETRKQWHKVENKYYDLVNNIFQGYSWSAGKYTGYASIYCMYPRHIKEKTFFFPSFSHNWNSTLVIGHEMLHFIFFAYIKSKYGINENDKFKGKNPKYVWQVSESFNTVIENWRPYKEVFGAKGKRESYPDCKKMFLTMTAQWSKNQNIQTFLDNWLLMDM